MIYVCSDIHGRFDRYERLLKEIQFNDTDTLYVLGDVIDRNPDGLEILQDIMGRFNVTLLVGNHEWFLLDAITDYDKCLCGDSTAWMWDCNGGRVTLEKFNALSLEERKKIVEYLENSLVVKMLSINGVDYHLSHSGALNDRAVDLYYYDLEPCDLEQLIWMSFFRKDELYLSKHWYNDKYTYIVGHVPVQRLGVTEIARKFNIINIDCGCAYGDAKGSSLACLRLDDMKEFYIK